MRTGSEIDCLGPQPRRPVPARLHESRSVDIIYTCTGASLFRKRAHFIVASASFSELGDDSIAWSGFTVILMLPNTSGAWAGTGVLDSKVAGGVCLCCISYCLTSIHVQMILMFPLFFAWFCCNSFSGFISSANFNFQLLALKILK